jgi:hypothetical protein
MTNFNIAKDYVVVTDLYYFIVKIMKNKKKLLWKFEDFEILKIKIMQDAEKRIGVKMQNV